MGRILRALRFLDKARATLYCAPTIPVREANMTVRTCGRRSVLSAIVALSLATSAWAGPSGQPIRIGGTLALTGALAPTALLHKLAGEIFVEELNKGNGLLGRPVEWVLLDD